MPCASTTSARRWLVFTCPPRVPRRRVSRCTRSSPLPSPVRGNLLTIHCPCYELFHEPFVTHQKTENSDLPAVGCFDHYEPQPSLAPHATPTNPYNGAPRDLYVCRTNGVLCCQDIWPDDKAPVLSPEKPHKRAEIAIHHNCQHDRNNPNWDNTSGTRKIR